MAVTEQKAKNAQENNGPSQALATVVLGAALFAGELASQYFFSKSSQEPEAPVTEPMEKSLASLKMPLKR